jgi:hypothetical protein
MIVPSIPPLCLDQEAWIQRSAELEAAKSLSAMVWIALQMGLVVARGLLEQNLRQRAEALVAWGHCPHCERRLQSKGWQARTLQTLVGQIT